MQTKTVLAASVLAAAFLVVPALAQDKPALTPGVVEQFDLASKLTNYGLERNDPILLLAAARLMTTIAPETAADAAPLGASKLIGKAREFAGGKGEIATLADSMESEVSRGLCYGPGTVYGCF